MSPGLGRAISRSDTLLLLICLLLSLGALFLPAPWALAVAGGIRETALVPLVWLQRNAEENRTSRARLRAMLRLPTRLTPGTVAAEVLRQTGPMDGRTLLLGTGSRAGVAAGSPVISAEGLVGLVVSAGPSSAVAITWAHPDFRASAVTEDGGVLGIVAPAPSPDASQAFLELRGVPYRDTVAVGTLVLTSGLTGVYPRGIPIGRVAGIRREELGWERIYRIRPLANPGYITHVLLYRSREPGLPDSGR